MNLEDRGAADASRSAVLVCPGLSHGHDPGQSTEIEDAGICTALLPFRPFSERRGTPGRSAR